MSGPVTQAFDFWSEWFRSVSKIGLINIDLGKAGDPDLERDILAEVGSYGRQLGQISDAVAVLIDQAQIDRTKLTDDQIVALHKFKEMLERIEACKTGG